MKTIRRSFIKTLFASIGAFFVTNSPASVGLRKTTDNVYELSCYTPRRFLIAMTDPGNYKPKRSAFAWINLSTMTAWAYRMGTWNTMKMREITNDHEAALCQRLFTPDAIDPKRATAQATKELIDAIAASAVK